MQGVRKSTSTESWGTWRLEDKKRNVNMNYIIKNDYTALKIKSFFHVRHLEICLINSRKKKISKHRKKVGEYDIMILRKRA